MKADKDYVFKGVIYLTGADMPDGWTPPVKKDAPVGVTMIGPKGQVTEMPGIPLPPNIALVESELPKASIHLEDRAFEDIVKMAKEKGIDIRNKKKDELIKALTPE